MFISKRSVLFARGLALGWKTNVLLFGALGLLAWMIYRWLKGEWGSPSGAGGAIQYGLFGQQARTLEEREYIQQTYYPNVPIEMIPERGLPGPGQVGPYGQVIFDLSGIGDVLGIQSTISEKEWIH